ncbi:FAD-dependent oxidoreductase, partial [Pseudomonas syringae]
WLAAVRGSPCQFFGRFFRNHGRRAVPHRPKGCGIQGGSRSYVEPLTASFRERIRLSCPVTRVERDSEGVTLHSAMGSERFDKVVFACHSDQALALLSQPSSAQQSIPGALRYADNDVVLHPCTRPVPQRQLAWARAHYRLGGRGEV